MTDDVEKRWTDEGTYRRATLYVLSVIALAAVVFGITAFWASAHCGEHEPLLCDVPAQSAVLIGPTVVALFGGIGAFVQTLRQWRQGRNWVIWQGAGWFLFTLTMFYIAISARSVGAN
ncbi:hypothetical protein GV794_08355 [Nocardia cyriacigeorgica]|uniref:Integral membrane protein n=1 Tax=Nocardia cyriacigeorgica TaxID=135487 RepID=A0A6P1D3K7_9NOCA|nr:hypothetical protein [Nocardia cyriacigeorgica]NEW40865.1 hypothetical protein [Nocardia cyriacigeorgica]NEW45156.1 hypothetical protein [Nocardia cyriacigeorgica]NEW50923.1 hypothetical protein [Nocardia cyriacigeorgica]NEW55663.1 hypothetical protein [Nocardia cyriacigeorgica]